MITLKQYSIGFSTILRKEISRFLRVWVQSLVPSAITMTLYFIIFGRLIGSQLPLVEGVTYMQYLAPGLIMMSIITNSYSNVVFSFFMARFTKSIEEILVSPLSNAMILIAYVTAGIARGLMVGFIVTVIALFFTHLKIVHFGATLGVVILSAALFSLAGFTNGLYAKKFDDTSIVPTFVLTPLTYFGGVFYSIKFLPSVFYVLSLMNPILYMVNAFRYGILGVSDVGLSIAFSMIATLTVLLFLFNLHLLNKGVGIKT